MRVLEMQATRRTATGRRNVVLHEGRRDTRLRVATVAPTLVEEPSRVIEYRSISATPGSLVPLTFTGDLASRKLRDHRTGSCNEHRSQESLDTASPNCLS